MASEVATTGKHISIIAFMDTVAFFQDLELRWASAIQHKDKKHLDEVFLAQDYALRISDDAARQISRADWLATISVYNTRSFSIRDLEVRSFGDLAVVSHVFTQQADVNGVDRSGDFFIVDVWIQQRKDWKVSARYSSPARVLPKLPLGDEGGMGREGQP